MARYEEYDAEQIIIKEHDENTNSKRVKISADTSDIDIISGGINDPLNSTTTALSSGGSFVGTGVLNNHSDVLIVCKTDQDGKVYTEFSLDGVNWDSSIQFKVTANVNNIHKLVKGPRYYRTRFVNDSGSAQTFLRLGTYYGRYDLLTSPLNSNVSQNADAVVSRVIAFEVEATNGKYNGYSYIDKYGTNTDIDNDVTPEDLWPVGGIYTGFPTEDETVEIFSSSNNDSLSSSGARTVQIEGLDSNGLYQVETVNLRGTSSATSINTFTRVNRLKVLTSGSNNTAFNVGTITARHSTTTANVFGTIQPGRNQSEIGCYTIPADCNGVLRNFFLSVDKSTTAVVTAGLYVKDNNKSPRIIRTFTVSNSDSGDPNPVDGIKFEPLTDITIRKLNCSANNVQIFGGFDIVLIKV